MEFPNRGERLSVPARTPARQGQQRRQGNHKTHLTSLRSSNTASRPSFYDIALSYGTDKVTAHHYHHMYQKYLSPYRDRHLKMLEIGLGCDMSYGRC